MRKKKREKIKKIDSFWQVKIRRNSNNKYNRKKIKHTHTHIYIHTQTGPFAAS